MDWIHPWIGLDWIGFGQDFQGTLWIALHWIGRDDCEPIFKISYHCSTVDDVFFNLCFMNLDIPVLPQ